MQDVLKVLMVVEPGVDGVYKHVDSLIRYLLHRGDQIHFAYSDRRSCSGLYRLIEDVEKNGGRTLNLRVSNYPTFGDLTALTRLYSLARELSPDVIHCHSSKAGVLGRTLRFLGVKAAYFYSPHAYFGLARQKSFLTPVYNSVETAFSRVGQTINASEDERQFAINRLNIDPSKCVRLNVPTVDPRVFRPSTAEERSFQRRLLGIPDDAVVLGSMGRISFQKDPETLYRAFDLATKRGLDLYLVHAGSGDPKLETKLDLLARSSSFKERLIRVPYYDEPNKFYSVIDALIMTSRYEGCWPTVLLEALACNLPVISGNGPGTSDLADAGLSHCWTANIGDIGGFADAIGQWYLDRSSRRLLNHRCIAESRFTPDICHARIADYYREAAHDDESTSIPVPA